MTSKLAEGDIHFIGPHRITFEPPDIARVSWNGTILPEHMPELYELSERVMTNERFFVIADLSGLAGVPFGARKAARTNPTQNNMAAIAFIGGSFHIRVLMNMLGKAISMFYPDAPTKYAFLASEEEARAWIDALRRPAKG